MHLRVWALLLVAGLTPAFSQSIISTFAGRDWIFPGDGKAALPAPLGWLDGMVYDRAGNLYFGDASNHMVFRLRDGRLEVVAGNGFAGASGDGGPARNASLDNPRGLAFDDDGNLYIADAFQNRIRRVTPSGTISTFAGTGTRGFGGDGGPAARASLNFPMGLAYTRAGQLLIVDRDNYRLRAIGRDGFIRTIAGLGRDASSGDGGPATLAAVRPYAVVVAPDGSIYFSEFNGQRVRRISPDGVVSTVAGNGTRDYSRDNVRAVESPLRDPAGLALDSAGNLFIGEFNGYRILRVDPSGTLRHIAGTAVVLPTQDGPALQRPVGAPLSLLLTPAGQVLYTDVQCECIGIVSGGNVRRYAGGAGYLNTEDGTPASLGYFDIPTGLTFDPEGNLYVADTGRAIVSRISTDGVFSRYAGMPPGGCCFDGRPAREALFSGPRGIAFDSLGQMYISEWSGNRIRRIDTEGIIRTIAGDGQSGFTGDDGPSSRARLSQPADIAIDAEGGIVIAEYGNRRVRRIGPDGNIRTIAGDGQDRYFGDGGPATEASFRRPLGLALTADGSILVADTVDSRIRRIGPDGIISTIAGTATFGFSGDGGPATEARINSPGSIAVDGVGNIFFLDRGNNRIRRIDTAGIITTVAGTGRRLNEGDGGRAVDASFVDLQLGLAVDSAGRLFVSDWGSGRVRVIEQSEVSIGLPPEPIRISLFQGDVSGPQALPIGASRAGVPVTLSADAPWITIDDSNVAAPASVQFTANARSLAPGTYEAVIQASSTVAAPAAVGVILTVAAPQPPRLSVSPPQITQSLEIPNTAQTRIRVTNAGSGTLRFAAAPRFDGTEGWMNVSLSGVNVTLGAGESSEVPVVFDTRRLAPGTQTGSVIITADGLPDQVVRVTLQVTQQRRPRILLSQAGYTFTAVAEGGTPQPQNLGVLNEGAGELTFAARGITLSGGDWLHVTPDSGRVDRPLRDVTFLDVAINPAGLAPGEYYGRVEVTAGPADNTPQIATVLLKVLPAGSAQVPEVRPAGLVFISEEGSNPGSQTIRVTNLKGGNTGFVSGPLTSDRGPWLRYSPDVGATTTEEPASMVVQPEHRALGPGVRTGAINLLFTDTGETRSVRVLSVVAPRGTANASGKGNLRFLGACPGATLRMQHLSLENSFVAVAGEPTDVRVRIIDDCGTPLTPDTAPNPLVSMNSDTGDEVRLVHVQDGEWRGTWRPRAAREPATVAISVIAGDLRTPAEILLRTGRVLAGGSMPVVRSGALRHSATLQTDVPVAPGHLISLLGNGLAEREETANTLPLPQALNDTEVLLGGRRLSLLYTSSGQINAQLPYDLPANTEQQLYVRRGVTLSVPEKFVIAAVQPGIFTANQQGFGQGIIVQPDGTTVANTENPAARGSEVIIYCSGLGAVTPEIPAGQAAPNPAPRVVAPLQVTIGGRAATIVSATLSPGVSGRYEVRVRVPNDSPTGNEIPVVLRANDRVSPTVTMAVR
ncbi:MAG: hypothetical protein JNK87_37295 [Bryobacterales bacterium]|nr:hypothetical protein [Bryobacterales bacterium]